MKANVDYKGLVWTLIFLFAGSLCAQSSFYKKWILPEKDWGRFVIETSDGGFAVIGSTSSRGAGNFDVWLIKTDSSGDTLWTRTYGGPDDDQGYCVRQTSDNGFLVAAYKSVPQRYKDGWVFKTDASGKLEWEHTFGTDLNGESATSIIPAEDRSFIVSGNSESKSYVFKIDEKGAVLWEHSYFSKNNTATNSICQVNADDYAVAGSYQLSAGGAWYPHIFHIDSKGNLLDSVVFPNEGGFQFITAGAKGELFAGGADNGQSVVYKISSDGTQQWNYRFYQDVWYHSATSGVVAPDNNIIITNDVFYGSCYKLDSATGDTLWTRTSTFNTDYPRFANVQTTSDNGLIITGYTDSHDLVLVKTTQNGVLTAIEPQGVHPQSYSLNQNFPNPFNPSTVITYQLPQSAEVSIQVYNALGQLIKTLISEEQSAGSHSVVWDGFDEKGRAVPSGIFMYTIQSKDFIKTRKMVLIR